MSWINLLRNSKTAGKVLKKSDSTITSVNPTLGKKETTAYKFKMAKDKLSKNIDKLVRSKNK